MAWVRDNYFLVLEEAGTLKMEVLVGLVPVKTVLWLGGACLLSVSSRGREGSKPFGLSS